MDEKPNLIELAKTQSALDDVRKANPNVDLSDIIHNGKHGKYDDLVVLTLEEVIKGMKKTSRKSDWEKFSKDEMLKVLQKTLSELRNTFMNEPDKLPRKKDGTLFSVPVQEGDTA